MGKLARLRDDVRTNVKGALQTAWQDWLQPTNDFSVSETCACVFVL